uniref:Uncharacterized protein n=1 Tax=Arundo donax TaxID=35708 RepID=A0A0A9E9B3_ARUDO
MSISAPLMWNIFILSSICCDIFYAVCFLFCQFYFS